MTRYFVSFDDGTMRIPDGAPAKRSASDCNAEYEHHGTRRVAGQSTRVVGRTDEYGNPPALAVERHGVAVRIGEHPESGDNGETAGNEQ